MARNDYPYEIRLQAAGYEPTPLGLEKLSRDLAETKRSLEAARQHDREIKDKGLKFGELDELKAIKEGLPITRPSLAELKDLMSMLEMLHASSINSSVLKKMIEAREFCKSKGMSLSEHNVKLMLERCERMTSERAERAELASLANKALENINEEYTRLQSDLEEGRERQEYLRSEVDRLRQKKGKW